MSALFNVVNQLPIKIVSAAGGYLEDETGKSYLDWYNDNGVASLGYDPLPINNQRSEHFLPRHLPQVYGSDLREEVALLLAGACGLDRVHFAMSGTDAVETAIKTARIFHHHRGDRGRVNIISIPDQYHGRTGWALAASTAAAYHKEGFGPIAEGFGVARPSQIVDRRGTKEGQPNLDDVDWGQDRVVHADQVAAVIMSPIKCANRARNYPETFHSYVRQWCDRNGALLIHDDVQTGAGRAGFAASWQRPDINVKPDIIALGKGLAAGYPLSATVARSAVANAITPGTHFYTAGASTVPSLLACRYLLKWLAVNKDWPENLGKHIVERLHGQIGVRKVWNYGALIGIEPNWKDDAHPDSPDFNAYDVFRLAREKHRLLILNFRPKNELKLTPRFNATESEVEHGIKALTSTLAELSQ